MKNVLWLAIASLFLFSACVESSPGGGELLERYLVKYSVCTGDSEFSEGLDLLAFHPILGHFVGPAEELISCFAAAQDCNAFWECSLGKRLDACDPESDEADSCLEGKLVQCRELPDGSAWRFVLDCGQFATMPGATCVETTWGAKCALGSCEAPEEPECQGDVIVSCEDGVLTRFDCGALGHLCVPGAHHEYAAPSCAPPGLVCRSDGDACIGDYYYECYGENTAEAGINCAELFPGSTCVEQELTAEQMEDSLRSDSSASFCGQPGDSWKDAWHSTQTCDGSLLTLCLGSSCRTFDCSLFLGATCVPDEENSRARCVSDQWFVPEEEW